MLMYHYGAKSSPRNFPFQPEASTEIQNWSALEHGQRCDSVVKRIGSSPSPCEHCLEFQHPHAS